MSNGSRLKPDYVEFQKNLPAGFKFSVKRKVFASNNCLFNCLAHDQICKKKVLQTIQTKLILLFVWAEQALFGSNKTA